VARSVNPWPIAAIGKERDGGGGSNGYEGGGGGGGAASVFPSCVPVRVPGRVEAIRTSAPPHQEKTSVSHVTSIFPSPLEAGPGLLLYGVRSFIRSEV
jgi:hypothetical protein